MAWNFWAVLKDIAWTRCQSLFFNKVAGLRPATLLKKRLWHRCFSVNFAKFLFKIIRVITVWWDRDIGAVLASLLLTLKRFPTLLWCIHFWLWASKYRGIKERPEKVTITFHRHGNLKKTEFKISCFEILCKSLCANALKYIVSKTFTQPPITSSNLTIETLGQGAKYFKVNNKDTRTTPMASFWCLYC